jgi:flavin-dependent dehydrogenase
MHFSIPVYAQVDLIVVGGATGGVAAACAAARQGRKVFLGAAESYAGEDVCANGRLWLDASVPLNTELSRSIYIQSTGERRTFVQPLHVKARLDDALLDAGVQFRFGCAPADLLVDGAGRLAGVLFTSKCGPFAITARQIIDATPAAFCARQAGVAFTPWPQEEPIAFSRVIIGAPVTPSDPGHASTHMLLAQPLGDVTYVHRGEACTRQACRYLLPLVLPSFSPEAVAEAEQTLRALTWSTATIWCSERVDWLLPDAMASDKPCDWTDAESVDLAAFLTSIPGLSVLGTGAALSRKDAMNLAIAPYAIAIGERLGAQVKASAPVKLEACRTLQEGLRDPLLFEPSTHPRPPAAAGDHLTIEPAGLPQFGTYDVVVVGGGTGGAPAALAAARAGGRVLLLEALHDLGGVGTLGCISTYYHGNREGFTWEVTQGLFELGGKDPAFDAKRWNPFHKGEWFRREIVKAGGRIWFGALASGVHKTGSRVSGVIVNTPWGRGVVRAGCVIDASGNADVAAAAGAECRIASEADLAIQGSGLPSRPFIPATHNTDYTFIDDCDLGDSTRAFVVARRRFKEGFEIAPLADTRERRQIVGDVTVTPVDVYSGKTWADAICLSRSNFDSHGFTVHPLFFALPPDRTSLDAWLPLRALLPKGLAGLLTTGLAISGHRDVMPVYRMQPDIQNHAYAAGLAAVMALARKGEVRRIDVRALQRRLVACGILAQTALLQRDTPPAPPAVLRTAATGPLDIHAELAALLTHPESSRMLLRQRFSAETDPELRNRCARMLAVIGDNTGAEFLIQRLRSAAAWDPGWNFRGMGQFGRSSSPLDDIILLLALARVGEAKEAVLEKIGQLGPDPDFSHIRSIAVYCEALPDAVFASALEAVLSQPALAHHAWTSLEEELANIPESSTDTTTRNNALRELYLARALWRCGDRNTLAANCLARYAQDIRGHFARQARKILGESHGHRTA